MNSDNNYPIGTPGLKWTEKDKKQWFSTQTIQRSYNKHVLLSLQEADKNFNLIQYGILSSPNNEYPLFLLKSINWKDNLPAILITGGVHGYETSGVKGAIRFATVESEKYSQQFNFIIAPCVSPWGFETINRWNPKAIDPNRSFYEKSPASESASLLNYINSLGIDFLAHIDLHETTDTDNSEFRPALSARDAITQDNWNIPDGFYLVGDQNNPADDFQKAIIDSVRKVTHIAPDDENNMLIGESISQVGVINYAAGELGLCMRMTNAPYVTTTEVYPDSPLVNDLDCINAQVAAISGALDYLTKQKAKV